MPYVPVPKDLTTIKTKVAFYKAAADMFRRRSCGRSAGIFFDARLLGR